MPTEALQEEDFTDSDDDQVRRWTLEFKAAREKLREFQEESERIVRRFLDKRDSLGLNEDAGAKHRTTRWPLFTTNIQTQAAMMYGKTPKADVSRKWGDPGDPVARVAALMFERNLNCDIENDEDTYAQDIGEALGDRLRIGFGNGRVMYEASFGKEKGKPAIVKDGKQLAEAIPETEKKTYESIHTTYLHWKDQLWSPARTYNEVRWWAYKSEMSRRQLVERFGKDIGPTVPLNAGKPDKRNSDTARTNPWGRAEVWEIWSKEDGEVYWFVEGYPKLLDRKPNPYQLEQFFPSPRPMMANLTSSGYVPRAHFSLVKDLYNEVDFVSTRIAKLEKAIKVAGVYDKTVGDLRRLVREAGDNELIPSENWLGLKEKGGLKGAIDFLPLDQIVLALDKLRDYRTELVAATYQFDGMSDIMRGQAQEVGVTATEQALKAKFASVRMQQLQDEFARFSTDLLKLKGELICKHYDADTIIQRSNILMTADGKDPALIQKAVELLKSDFAQWRIEVKPEAVAMTDFASLKAERSEWIGAVANFIQAMVPIVQALPGSAEHLLELLKWTTAGLKGSSEAEATLDRAIAAVQQMQKQQAAMPQQQQVDPKVQAAQLKMQGDAQRAQFDMQKEQAKLQGDLVRIHAETQAKDAQEQSQARWNIAEAKGKKAIAGPGPLPAFTPNAGPGGAA